MTTASEPRVHRPGPAVAFWLVGLLAHATGAFAIPPYRLSGDPPPASAGGSARNFAVASDGTFVVYTADHAASKVRELFRAPIDGSSAPVRLNAPLPNGVQVGGFALVPDGARVVYITGEVEYTSRLSIFRARNISSARLDGSGEPVALGAPLPSGAEIKTLDVSPDGERIVYAVAVHRDPGRYTPPWYSGYDAIELFSQSLGGDDVPVKLTEHLFMYAGEPGSGYVLLPDASRIVYWADETTPWVGEIYSRPLDGTGPAVKLNGPLPLGHSVVSFRSTPDASRVVYLADQDTPGVTELYSRSPNGGDEPVRLNTPLSSGGDVQEVFHITPDGSRVIYVATEAGSEDGKLYSRELDGRGPPIELSNPADRLYSAFSFQPPFWVSPDGRHVIYRVREPSDLNHSRLFSVPVDRVHPPVALTGFVEIQELLSFGKSFVAFTPDASRILYAVRDDSGDAVGLYIQPIDGSGPATVLDRRPGLTHCSLLLPYGDPEILVTPDGRSAVYCVREESGIRLYAAALDASSVPVPLVPPPTTIFSCLHHYPGCYFDPRSTGPLFTVTPDSQRVLYLGALDLPDSYGRVSDVFSARIGSDGTATRLGLPRGPVGSVSSYAISPDATFVTYTAAHDTVGVDELYRRPLDGSGRPVKINPPLPPGGQVTGFEIAPDAGHVLYLADQDTVGVTELFSQRLPDGSVPLKLNGPLGSGESVRSFHIAPDASRAVYLTDRDGRGPTALFSRPLDGGSAAVELDMSLPSNGRIGQFEITGDARQVVLRADVSTGDGASITAAQLYAGPVDGSAAFTPLATELPAGFRVALFRLPSTGNRVVFVAEHRDDRGEVDGRELYSLPLDGTGALERLDGPLPPLYRVDDFSIAPNGATVVYRIRGYSVWNVPTEANAVYSRAVDAGSPAVELAGALTVPPEQTIERFFIAPESEAVLYSARGIGDQAGIFRRSIRGHGAAVRVSPFPAAQGAVLAPDGRRIVDSIVDFAQWRCSDDGGCAKRGPAGTVALRSLPLTGSDTPSTVTEFFSPGVQAISPSIAPDSRHVAYLSDERYPGVYELWASTFEPTATCGDGRLDPDEGCDDGGNASGDGCDAYCRAAPGWTCPTPGARCENRDECGSAIDDCALNAMCTDTPGSFACQCNAGFTGDGRTCTCIGDCRRDGTVTVDDVLVLVNIALGSEPPGSCSDGGPPDGRVDVGWIIQAVRSVLYGCGAG